MAIKKVVRFWGETGILSMGEKRRQTLVIDDSHAREPSGLVRLSKTAAWISLTLHRSEKASSISFFVISAGDRIRPVPAH